MLAELSRITTNLESCLADNHPGRNAFVTGLDIIKTKKMINKIRIINNAIFLNFTFLNELFSKLLINLILLNSTLLRLMLLNIWIVIGIVTANKSKNTGGFKKGHTNLLTACIAKPDMIGIVKLSFTRNGINSINMATNAPMNKTKIEML